VFEKWFGGSTGNLPVPSGESPNGTGATVRVNGHGLFVTLLAAVSVGGSPTGGAGRPRHPFSKQVLRGFVLRRYRMIAITHVPSPKMDQCERTFVDRTPIDYERATRQHEEYCRMLRACGSGVITLDVNRGLPDCAFVEDTAIVLNEAAVLAAMGA